jgi:hypothetical protein
LTKKLNISGQYGQIPSK